MDSPRIAFLGLGIMGGGMARRLLGAGFPLTVYNRDGAKSAPFATEGALIGASPREAAEGADIVFSMVADDVASRSLWQGDNGALAALHAGAIGVECSTLSVGWVRELAQGAAARGADFVDAPVTGSKDAAATGQLNFLVGGNAPTLERILPALRAMSRGITHLGPTGSGALVKLVNNFMAGVHVAAFAEALAWVEGSGVDRERAVAALLDGAAASPVTKVVAARMMAADFTPNFLLRLMAKDLDYAVTEAAKNNVRLDTGATARERFRAAIAAGLGDQDMAALVDAVRAKSAAE